ncbi:MAG: DUF433 domain-containing protein [Opitutus sp.]|nr:DUF433 domain-containing protein [Opitutus sp.]
MSHLARITFNANQCGGRPCIRGMRIRVKDVLDMLAAGESETTILTDYPDLVPEDIRACLEYAATQVDHAVLSLAK